MQNLTEAVKNATEAVTKAKTEKETAQKDYDTAEKVITDGGISRPNGNSSEQQKAAYRNTDEVQAYAILLIIPRRRLWRMLTMLYRRLLLRIKILLVMLLNNINI